MGHRVTTLNVNTIEPAGNTLTIGASGDTVVLADDVKANTYKDAGGNTLFVSNGSGVLSSVNSGFGDALKLLSTQTASNSASISFTSGIDSTYKEYIFKFINMDGDSDVLFQFQCSTDGGSNYNTAITSTYFYSRHTEDGESTGLAYQTSADQAQGTAFQRLAPDLYNAADASISGELHLFNPAATYVKNYYSTVNSVQSSPGAWTSYIAGYFNTATAINAIQFKMNSGNTTGKIKMYGVL